MYSSKAVTPPQFVVTFEERLFGGKCVIEVAIDLSTLTALSTLSMTSMFSERPVFTMPRADFNMFVAAIRRLQATAKKLSPAPEGSIASQLNCTVNAATAVIFQAEGKPVRYTLNIGNFSKAGELTEMDLGEIEEAIRKMDELEGRVLRQVNAG
jgi:hypothetical protein